MLIIHSSMLAKTELPPTGSIIILAEQGDSFPAQVVEKIMKHKSCSIRFLPKDPGDIEIAFEIGKIIGSDKDAACILPEGDLKKTLIKAGLKSSTQPKPRKRSADSAAKAPEKKASPVKEEEFPMPKPADGLKKEQTEPVKKPAKKRKSRSSFEKILEESGINASEADGIKKAVAASNEPISYELQLRFAYPGDPKAAEIFEKTKDRFDELKKSVS